jgi:transposase
MKPKYYRVFLTDEERKCLMSVVKTGRHPAQMRTRANILLELDESRGGGDKDQLSIADALKTSTSTIYQTSKRYVESGVEGALARKKRITPPVPSKVDGDIEAKVIALACSTPPEGYSRWTLRLLEERVAYIEGCPELSDNTIGRLLKKRRLSLT